MEHEIHYNHKRNQFHNNDTKNKREKLVVLALIKLLIDSILMMMNAQGREREKEGYIIFID